MVGVHCVIMLSLRVIQLIYHLSCRISLLKWIRKPCNLNCLNQMSLSWRASIAAHQFWYTQKRPWVVCFRNRTPTFDCLWFGEDQSAKHRKDTCLKEIGLRLQILMTTQQWTQLGGPTYPGKESTKHALPITIGDPIFNPVFAYVFIVDLLMQHKFRCVNLIGRGCWRTWKNKPKNTHTP